MRTFLREMEVAGAEIGTALAGLATSLFMIALTISKEPPNQSFFEGLSVTFTLMLFLGAVAAMSALLVTRFGKLITQARTLLRAGYGLRRCARRLSLTLARGKEGRWTSLRPSDCFSASAARSARSR